MQYKVGDVVWYLDRSVTPIPRVKSGKVVNVLPDEEIYKVDFLTWDYTTEEYLFPTKEALLAAIDSPPPYNLVVGQTIWYLDVISNRDAVEIRKDFVTCVDLVEGKYSVYLKRFSKYTHYPMSSDNIFITPDEAFAKAKEVQGW